MISILDKTQWQNLVAGVAGGVASVLILHPLDLAKVRLQVNEGTGVVAYRPKTTGTIRTLYEIVRSRGLRGLYLGLTPNAIGAGSSWGLYFCFLKKFAQHGDETKYLSSSQYLTFAALSGELFYAKFSFIHFYLTPIIFSGIVTLSIVNPIWVIKTRLCLQYEKGIKCTHKNSSVLVNSSQSTWHALYNLWMNEGFSGLYRGYVPGLFGVSHGAIQFLFYEHFKNLYNMYYRRTSVSEKLDQHRKYNGVIDVIQQLWRGEGVHGFYKGLVPYVLRCMPSCGITFLVYEYSLMIFDWIK
ncbi:Mitochondrial folate transporter/carrier [Schistosoma japonicum]|nr:Mitochondrial folate transporter/carrier [Schistosoma japonicum]